MYIILNKTKLEERIKELENINYDILSTRKAFEAELINSQKISLLQKLLKESIDAETVFNAGRKEEDWSDVAAGDLCYKYEDCFEYTKTLNI